MSFSVILVTYNDQETIGVCLDSILRARQTGSELEILVIDNASTDGTLAEVRSRGIEPIALQENTGFCAANNLGFRKSSGEWVVFLNPDACITPTYLEQLASFMKQHPRAAMATGKVLRMAPSGESVVVDGKPVIDTAGIKLHINRQAVDRGSGQTDIGQYSRAEQVDAVCGAVCFCRREALEALAVDGQVFDERFFAYKEDVDLGWRARRLGWECWYVPNALAYHARNWKGSRSSRDQMSLLARYHSYKNRRLMILKNETWPTAIISLLPVLAFELASFLVVLLRERELLRVYGDLWQSRGYIRHWREQVGQIIHGRNNRHP